MKKVIVFCILITGIMLLVANNKLLCQNGQNLVPNFSFEQYDTCPNAQDQIQYAIGWRKYSKGGNSGVNTTPDYLNSCAKPGISVPITGRGYRTDERGCNAFAGLGIIEPGIPDYRECIGIQLKQPLIIGHKYYLSFHVAASLVKLGTHYYALWSNNIGIKLSTIPYNGNNPVPIDNYAHLNSNSIIKDTVNWHLISGSIIADSAYDYLIIGNFYDQAHTDTLHYNCKVCLNMFSYYFVDDVCLSTDSLLCNSGIVKLPCDAAVNEIKYNNNEIKVFPNPIKDFLNISSQENLDAEIIIYNIPGNIVYKDKLANKNNLTINLSSLSEGCYFLKIINNKNHLISNFKILII